jgi:glucose/mannose-6-phosphate isomerase
MTHDIEKLRAQHDPGDMYGKVAGFPSQMKAAWKIGADFVPHVPAGGYSRIVVCGMGGSAIGGDLLRSFFGDRLRAPLVGCRDYSVPRYLTDGAFVIVSSYSGNTGETLSAYESLRGSGAKVVAVTSGGELAKKCEADSVPVCLIPGGMPPRSAIGYSFLPMTQILRAAGLGTFEDSEFDEALEAIEALCEACAMGSDVNPALDLALELRGRLPFIYAGPGLLEAAARRWACQFNENAKMLAHFAYYTELNHNEIVGWETQEGLMDEIVVVSLEDRDDHPMTSRQADVGLGIIEELSGGIIRLRSEEGGRMKRLLTTMVLGDFASVYMALLAGVDPTPVKKIDFLKQQLKKVES